MPPLDSEQLGAVQKLVTEPLLRELRSSLDAGRLELAGSIATVARRLDRHDVELRRVRVRIRRVERFRQRVAAVYGLAALIAGSLWAALGDWVKHQFLTAKS